MLKSNKKIYFAAKGLDGACDANKEHLKGVFLAVLMTPSNETLRCIKCVIPLRRGSTERNLFAYSWFTHKSSLF